MLEKNLRRNNNSDKTAYEIYNSYSKLLNKVCSHGRVIVEDNKFLGGQVSLCLGLREYVPRLTSVHERSITDVRILDK